MNREMFIGAFFGGSFGMLLYGTLEYYWEIGGLAPVLYIILLSMVAVIWDIFARVQNG